MNYLAGPVHAACEGCTVKLTLPDKHSGCKIFLRLRDGVVVGAMGSDPKRYIGLTEARARHLARYGGKS